MTVRIGKMTFSDWVSLPFQDGWSDTFIFRIDAQACIPPFEFAPLLKRMAAHTFANTPALLFGCKWMLLANGMQRR